MAPEPKKSEVIARRTKDNRGRKFKEVQEYEEESKRKIAEWQKQISLGIDEKGNRLT